LITRAERMRRNSIHRYPPELKSAIRVISKLKRTIQEVEHEEQD
ncbi:HNH endonuclease, partial [Pseudomonas aeruginosa]|nr:HNH endonuclease [Pseudomonas aeruginosa]MBX6852285.1 HNH endonuclease [Pseudomonas aeruginosa]MBX6896701.1 HNH endonuclease [Pseudomonas aeruginosa]MCG0354226.1 HNH endonuclease [Pseudomonas aeruginosa]MCV3978361.1 HNH endonuclease [Pseudomonas aeruginosa]